MASTSIQDLESETMTPDYGKTCELLECKWTNTWSPSSFQERQMPISSQTALIYSNRPYLFRVPTSAL
jgi:hypothetical protein